MERVYDAAPVVVFDAFTDPDAQAGGWASILDGLGRAVSARIAGSR